MKKDYQKCKPCIINLVFLKVSHRLKIEQTLTPDQDINIMVIACICNSKMANLMLYETYLYTK